MTSITRLRRLVKEAISAQSSGTTNFSSVWDTEFGTINNHTIGTRAILGSSAAVELENWFSLHPAVTWNFVGITRWAGWDTKTEKIKHFHKMENNIFNVIYVLVCVYIYTHSVHVFTWAQKEQENTWSGPKMCIQCSWRDGLPRNRPDWFSERYI